MPRRRLCRFALKNGMLLQGVGTKKYIKGMVLQVKHKDDTKRASSGRVTFRDAARKRGPGREEPLLRAEGWTAAVVSGAS